MTYITGTYCINHDSFITQPTAGQWIPREPLGIDGNGHAVYPALREFEMVWDFMDLESAHQLQDFYNNTLVTGTVIVDLPNFNSHPTGTDPIQYQLSSYTGCVLREPEFGQYFEYSRGDVKLLIVRIRT
jgi:hypothetical protein